jgi:hypothetical protein
MDVNRGGGGGGEAGDKSRGDRNSSRCRVVVQKQGVKKKKRGGGPPGDLDVCRAYERGRDDDLLSIRRARLAVRWRSRLRSVLDSSRTTRLYPGAV